MHIVDVCAFYTPEGGGVKTYVERKLHAAAQLGHRLTVIAPGKHAGEEQRVGGSRIVTIPGRRFPLDGRYRYFHDEASLHATLDHLRPDVVESSSPWTSAAMVGRWRADALKALVMHADPLSAYAYRWFGPLLSRRVIDRGFEWFWAHLRRLDRSFDMVVSANRQLSTRLEEGGLGRIVTIPMGVEPGVFTPRLRDERLRARLLARCGLEPDAVLLVGVGRHAAEKRWRMVIDAVTAAALDHAVGLILIGDGRERSDVVKGAGQNPHIQLLASMSDRMELARTLASCDALVHGCEAETFCMVASEARASGLPIIVPDDGGAADQFEPGRGVRYRAADGASLAACLKDFLSSNPHGQRLCAAAAASDVRSMDDHFKDLFAAYETGCTGPSRRQASLG